MLCVACGADVPAGSRFCPRCGRATSAAEAAPPDNRGGSPGGPPSGPPPEPPSMPPPPPPPLPPPTPPPSSGGYGGAPTGYAPPPPGYGAAPGPYSAPPGYGGGTAGPVSEGLATFGQRVGATVIDTFILWVVMAVGFL